MDTVNYNSFVQLGLNIMYYRKERGLTQLDLAEASNLSRNQVQRIETAASAPSLTSLFNIARALGIPIQKLFDVR